VVQYCRITSSTGERNFRAASRKGASLLAISMCEIHIGDFDANFFEEEYSCVARIFTGLDHRD
jgi:hypothetical protein